jgi:hypothetical protein
MRSLDTARASGDIFSKPNRLEGDKIVIISLNYAHAAVRRQQRRPVSPFPSLTAAKGVCGSETILVACAYRVTVAFCVFFSKKIILIQFSVFMYGVVLKKTTL